MARSSSGAIVAALTAAALAAVGFLAYQADAAPGHPHAAASSSSTGGKDGGKDQDPAADSAAKDKAAKEAATAVPANSGTGARVVYGIAAKRVWLVGADGRASRTFEVAPSTVNPPPGSYKVTSRTPNAVGSDGVPIEHIVRFHYAAGVAFGFSAAVDGSSPDPASTKKTGGIREKPADGRAMWEFAVGGSPVVVVP